MRSECRTCGKPRGQTSATCGHCGARVSLDDLGPKTPPSPEPARRASREYVEPKSVDHWKFLFGAAALLVLGGYLFVEFSALESGELEVMYVNSIVALLYHAVGKWGVLLLFGLPAAFVLFVYARALLPESDS